MADLSTPTPGVAFFDGSSAVGVTAADRPTNNTATAGPTNNLICDRTGFKVSVSDGLKKEWTGRTVRASSYESRHPLDFMRPNTSEGQKGSEAPEGTDEYISDLYPNGVGTGDL
jgi:hypothetical protein